MATRNAPFITATHTSTPTHTRKTNREAAAASRRNQRQAVAKEQLASKLAAAQAAEDAKMAQFRALLSQGPITIAKRT